MAFKINRSKNEPMSEINVTPFVDVMLVLLIIFMVTAPLLTVLTLPFMIRQPIDLPPIVSVELIQISDKTNIPFAPKAREIIKSKLNFWSFFI